MTICGFCSALKETGKTYPHRVLRHLNSERPPPSREGYRRQESLASHMRAGLLVSSTTIQGFVVVVVGMWGFGIQVRGCRRFEVWTWFVGV